MRRTHKPSAHRFLVRSDTSLSDENAYTVWKRAQPNGISKIEPRQYDSQTAPTRFARGTRQVVRVVSKLYEATKPNDEREYGKHAASVKQGRGGRQKVGGEQHSPNRRPFTKASSQRDGKLALGARTPIPKFAGTATSRSIKGPLHPSDKGRCDRS